MARGHEYHLSYVRHDCDYNGIKTMVSIQWRDEKLWSMYGKYNL